MQSVGMYDIMLIPVKYPTFLVVLRNYQSSRAQSNQYYSVTHNEHHKSDILTADVTHSLL